MSISFRIGTSGEVPDDNARPYAVNSFSLSLLINNGTKEAAISDRTASLELPLSDKALLSNFSTSDTEKTFSGKLSFHTYGAVEFRVAEATFLALPLPSDIGDGDRPIGLTLALGDEKVTPTGVRRVQPGADFEIDLKKSLPDIVQFHNLPKQTRNASDCRVLAGLDLVGDHESGIGKGSKLTQASCTLIRTVENDLHCPLYHVAKLSLLPRSSRERQAGDLWDLCKVGATISLSNGAVLTATGFLVESFSLTVGKGTGDDTFSVTETLSMRLIDFSFMDKKFQDKDLLANVYRRAEAGGAEA